MSNIPSVEGRLSKIAKEMQGGTSEIEEIKPIKKKVILVIGAGDGLGGAVAKEFASNGFITVVCRRNKEKLEPLVKEMRNKGYICHPYGVDARKEDEVEKLIEDVESTYGPIEVGVFNIGVNIKVDVKEVTSRQYFKLWEMNCFSGFLFGKALSDRMLKRQRGTIIFTGATASLRGAPGFSAFSSSKQALRAFAQSLAKEVGPSNIHIAHVIVDGGIDSEFIRQMLFDRLKDDIPKEDQLLQPKDIAKNYWYLYKQPKNAWTFELDLRPYTEKW